MNVNIGNIYFIKQTFFDLVNDETLPKNKPTDQDGQHNRPAFCAIKFENSGYYWVVPFSHQVDKYRNIFEKNMEKYGRCDTLAFGFVLGEEKAFLIQNMFPVTEKYINNIYLDKNTNKPIQLSETLKQELISKANRILSLYNKKGIKLVFTDIEKILRRLNVIS